MSRSAAAVAFVGWLVWRFPELLEELGEHLTDNGGEILPHVFMAAVERWAEELVADRHETLVALLAELDRGLDSQIHDIANLVDVSFVENLPYPGEPHDEIRDLLPPRLRGMLRHGI